MRQKLVLPLIVFWISISMPANYSSGNYHMPGLNDSDALMYAALNDTLLNREAFEIALKGHRILIENGAVNKPGLLSVIDYSLPSTTERLYVIDMRQNRILHKCRVAHGRNSGELYATTFSNLMHSHQSSVGFFITGNSYRGAQGYSMYLLGQDSGYNDNALQRSVVIHGADYVTEKYIQQYGRAGRSFGCPAIPPDVNKEIIDLISEGSVIFSYYPMTGYLQKSTVLTGRFANSL